MTFWTDTDTEPDEPATCTCGSSLTWEYRDYECVDEIYTQFWKCGWCGETFETHKNIFEDD